MSFSWRPIANIVSKKKKTKQTVFTVSSIARDTLSRRFKDATAAEQENTSEWWKTYGDPSVKVVIPQCKNTPLQLLDSRCYLKLQSLL